MFWIDQKINNSCLISTVMKPTPFLQQVFHLIIDLLTQQGHQEMAEQLAQKYELPSWVVQNNPLLKKGLIKIVKDYVRSRQKMLEYYQNRVEVHQGVTTRKQSLDHSRRSSSPKVQPKIKVKSPKAQPKIKATSPIVSKPAETSKSSWMSKFEKPKTLEQITTTINPPLQKEEVIVGEKKSKGKKKVESEQYESDQDSFELEPKKKLKKQAKEEKKKDKKKKKEKVQSEEQEEAEVEIKPKVPKSKPEVEVKPQKTYPTQVSNEPKSTFSRINIKQIGPIQEELKDNSFQAKARFGQQADHWGQFGYEKLKDTRGDSFKKTKGKLKNRAFQGALMDINKINSIPIL